ncbi:MAG TPA: hypothetical protein EYP49_13040 [Anaerolineae bacterium]|nr:hypothetical protein [Anaerolineae bacterium]
MTITHVDVLTTIARSLVHTRQYRDVDEALRGLALDEVSHKIARYRRRIRHFEHKYGMDFQTFSARLEDGATIAEEDDWMAWRSALSLLADWERAYRELQSAPLVPDILRLLQAHPLVQSLRVVEHDETPFGKLVLKVRCQLAEGYRFQLWLHHEPAFQNYAYQLFTTIRCCAGITHPIIPMSQRNPAIFTTLRVM